MKKAFVFHLLITCLGAQVTVAQGVHNFQHLVGGSTNVWQFTDRTDHHDAVVRVSVGQASGTGTIVSVDRSKPSGTGFEGYCVTAYHVVRERPESNAIKVHYRNGKSARKCKLVAFNDEYDTALLWVWVPDKLVAARVATTPVKGLDQLELCGLGGNSRLNCCLRSFSASASLPTTDNQLFADVSLLPGDSGGPVFNSNRELAGVISGGWLWWEAGVRGKSGEHIMATWPARASNSTVLRKLLDRAIGPQQPTNVIPVMDQMAQSE